MTLRTAARLVFPLWLAALMLAAMPPPLTAQAAPALLDVATAPARNTVLRRLAADPATAPVARALGSGAKVEARSIADRLLAAKPLDDDANLAWLFVRFEIGADEAALAQLDRLDAAAPEQAQALRETLAALYFADRRDYRAALTLQLGDPSRVSDDARYLLAHVHARQRSLGRARDELSALAGRYPASVPLIRDVAELELVANRPEAAETAARRWVQLAPGDARARLTMGLASLKTGHRDEAEKTLDALVSDDPGNLEAQWALGLARLEAGRPKPALEAFVASRARAGSDARAAVGEAAAALLAGDAARAASAAIEARRIDPHGTLPAFYVWVTAGDERSALPREVVRVAAQRLPDIDRLPVPAALRAEFADPAMIGVWAVAELLSGFLGPTSAQTWLEGQAKVAGPSTVLALVEARQFALDGRRAVGASGQAGSSQEPAAAASTTGFVTPLMLQVDGDLVRSDHARAVATVRRAVAIAPESYVVAAWAARVLARLGDPEAAAAYDRAVRLGRPDAELLVDHAAFLIATRSPEGARRALDIVSDGLEGTPHYLTRARMLRVRADALYVLGRRAEAYQAYRSLSTTVGGITDPSGWHRYAELALSWADRAGARRAFERALDSGQPDPLRPRAEARVRALEPP